MFLTGVAAQIKNRFTQPLQSATQNAHVNTDKSLFYIG